MEFLFEWKPNLNLNPNCNCNFIISLNVKLEFNTNILPVLSPLCWNDRSFCDLKGRCSCRPHNSYPEFSDKGNSLTNVNKVVFHVKIICGVNWFKWVFKTDVLTVSCRQVVDIGWMIITKYLIGPTFANYNEVTE